MMIKSNVKVLMAQENLSIIDLAEKIGITRQALSKLVNNQLKEFDGEVLDKLCKYFKCDVGDILKFVPEEKVA